MLTASNENVLEHISTYARIERTSIMNFVHKPKTPIAIFLQDNEYFYFICTKDELPPPDVLQDKKGFYFSQTNGSSLYYIQIVITKKQTKETRVIGMPISVQFNDALSPLLAEFFNTTTEQLRAREAARALQLKKEELQRNVYDIHINPNEPSIPKIP